MANAKGPPLRRRQPFSSTEKFQKKFPSTKYASIKQGRRDLAGRRFGRWVVVRRDGSIRSGGQWKALWQCVCDCGTERLVRGSKLRAGRSRSCGCFRPRKLIDLEGQRFGRWIVLRRDGSEPSDLGAVWKCRCDSCGLLYRVRSKDLRAGKTEGCAACRWRLAASAAAWSTVKEEKEKAAADPGRRPISRVIKPESKPTEHR